MNKNNKILMKEELIGFQSQEKLSNKLPRQLDFTIGKVITTGHLDAMKEFLINGEVIINDSKVASMLKDKLDTIVKENYILSVNEKDSLFKFTKYELASYYSDK